MYNSMGYTMPSSTAHRLSNVMRSLWTKHVWQDREATLSIVDGLSTKQSTVNWALQTPGIIANEYRSFYDQTICNKIENLLTNHIKIAGDVITYAATGDGYNLEMAKQKWYANANSFSAYMGSLNPYTPANQVGQMMTNHLNMLSAMTTDIINGNFDQGIKVFDQVITGAEQMGDFFAKGLVEQFPNRFI